MLESAAGLPGVWGDSGTYNILDRVPYYFIRAWSAFDIHWNIYMYI